MTANALPSLIWGSPQWAVGALALMAVVVVSLVWTYGRAPVRPSIKILGATLKGVGLAILVVSLVEPLLTGSKARPGANAFVVLADNSQSLLIKDEPSSPSRGAWAVDKLRKENPWRTRLAQDFDVRGYAFDSHLRAVDGFDGLKFDGTGTSMGTSLAALSRRFKGLPLAGVLMFTDGNRTDTGELDWSSLPPIYPVIPPSGQSARDVGVTDVSITQTNFESAPVVIKADVIATGYPGETIVAVVLDESGKIIERQEAKAPYDGKAMGFRFQFRPDKRGISFAKVQAYAASAETRAKEKAQAVDEAIAGEQTFANNSRLVVIDQGGGPYRVLYVSGRPNWEFKFLRRAIAEDEQVQLVALIRIARRQPKFDFQTAGNRKNAQLFENFDLTDPDSAERADQPVLVRLGTLDEVELRDGFPKVAEELYKYHAIVIDDLESSFFNQDQLGLVRNFVSQRGGGLLMLGGPDSFVDGKYDRTPIGELLPVYLDRIAQGLGPVANEGQPGSHRLVLTREGWLQPWVRTRKTEGEEQLRLEAMAPFHTLSQVGGIKPGASVLAQVKDPAGMFSPALVAQQFGKGHVAALMIGDLWRWGLKREKTEDDDLDRSWRQTVRWLVGDVPGRVEVAIKPKLDSSSTTPRPWRRPHRPRPRCRVPTARQRQGRAHPQTARGRRPHPQRRGRRPRGRLLHINLRRSRARSLSSARHRDRPRRLDRRHPRGRLGGPARRRRVRPPRTQPRGLEDHRRQDRRRGH